MGTSWPARLPRRKIPLLWDSDVNRDHLSELESTMDDLTFSITWPRSCALSFSFDEEIFESVGRHWPRLKLDDYNYELICPKLRLADRSLGLTHFPALASTTSAAVYLWVPCSFDRVVNLFRVPSTTYVCPKSIHEPVDPHLVFVSTPMQQAPLIIRESPLIYRHNRASSRFF